MTFAKGDDVCANGVTIARAVSLFEQLVNSVPCPHAFDFRVRVVTFRKCDFRRIGQCSTSYISVNADVYWAVAAIASVNTNRFSVIQVGQLCRRDVVYLDAFECKLQICGDGVHQFASERGSLLIEIIAA